MTIMRNRLPGARDVAAGVAFDRGMFMIRCGICPWVSPVAVSQHDAARMIADDHNRKHHEGGQTDGR